MPNKPRSELVELRESSDLSRIYPRLSFRPIFILFLGSILGLGQLGCNGTEKTGTCVHTIGAIFALTGDLAGFGESSARGLRMALEADLISGDGCKVQLEIVDGKGDVSSSITEFTKLRRAGVEIFVTNMSSIALALANRVAKDSEDLLLFADAAHPDLTRRSGAEGALPRVFRHSSVATQEAELLVSSIPRSGEETARKRIGIAVVNNDYGIAILEALRGELQANTSVAEVVRETRFDPSDTEFLAVARDLQAVEPDAVILVGYSRSLGLLLNFLRDGGYSGDILCSVGFMVTRDAVNIAGPNADGVIFNAFRVREESESYNQFRDTYERQFATPPPQNAFLMYNTGLLLRSLLEASDEVAPEILAGRLISMGRFDGAGETIEIRANGDLLPELATAKYLDGKVTWR